MSKTKKLVISGVLSAVGVAGSLLHIPLGAIKLSPVQHLVNVLAGVLLGPWHAVGSAFTTSLIRVLLGLGSPLAFPGSMCGALLCGLAYRVTKNKSMAFGGEVIGTGLFGALLAYPAAKLFLGKTIALSVLIPSFGLSTLAGAALSMLILKSAEQWIRQNQNLSKEFNQQEES